MKVKDLIELLSKIDADKEITMFDDNHLHDYSIKGITNYGEGYTLYGEGAIYDK